MQRYFATSKENNLLTLSLSDIHHIKNVMRMGSGDIIECIYEKKLYLCEIINIENNLFKITKQLPDYNELKMDITIAIALVKEQKMDLILQKLTELGVNKIIPLQMTRSIIKIDSKKEEKKLARWTSICKEAAEQSKRNIIPEVTNIKTLKELITTTTDIKKKYICSVANKENLINNYLQNNNNYDKMLFVIGPEGGITAMEESLLNENGFTSVSLGNRVMRVETAAIYIASIVNYSSMG